ncbi:MAG: hypothetical protein ABSD96_00730 [Candidatus Korobacteraceae bacterium]
MEASLNTQKLTTESSAPHWPSRDYWLVALCACVASLASFLWFFRHGELLLYGDAVAHINIARRVFDSRTPGLDQLGTVWLPLPHLLSLPFLVNDWMWRSGVGGSIASMIAYVFAVVGVFRLVRGRASRFAAWLAAALLGLNPNLLYMQSTAMTESIFLACVIWAVVYFDEFVRGLGRADSQSGKLPHSSKRSLGGAPAKSSCERDSRLPAPRLLERCGMVLAAAMLTRYDGWVLAFVIGCAAVAVIFWKRRQLPQGLKPTPLLVLDGAAKAAPLQRNTTQTNSLQSSSLQRNIGVTSSDHARFAAPVVSRVRRSLAACLLLCALTPALWLAHNYAINYKPLDWWNGPYSAQAIEARSEHDFPYPGKHNLGLAAKQFLKAARLNFSSGFAEQRMQPSLADMLSEWQTWMLALAVGGTLIAVLSRERRVWAWLLLWIPLPFYASAIAYGSVPVFLPVWWPFSYYNVRYGLELLPAFAVFGAVATEFIVERRAAAPRRRVAAGALVLLLAANYLKVADATPICLREARTNSVSRMRLESQLAAVLAGLPPHSTLLMYSGEYVGALQSADVHLLRVVNETGKMIWDAGLSCPAQVADYVVAVNGDPVAQAVARNLRWLEKIAAFSTPGKPDVTVYRSTFPGRQH